MRKKKIDRLGALATAALDLGMSYGKLVACTTPEQRACISKVWAQKMHLKLVVQPAEEVAEDAAKRCQFCGRPIQINRRVCDDCKKIHHKRSKAKSEAKRQRKKRVQDAATA